MNKKYHYLLNNLRCRLSPEPNISRLLTKAYPFIYNSLKSGEVSFTITRRSIDARHKDNLCYNYTIILHSDKAIDKLDKFKYSFPSPDKLSMVNLADNHPFIIGMGPAGLFCALELVDRGFQPYLFDRGKSVEERHQDVNTFWDKALLNPDSNVQYGEGGAGTFSDGKLTARNRTVYSQKVFDYLVQFGADPDIKINALPHLGTDGLKLILTNIRNYLISKGAQFFFSHKLTDISINNNKIDSVTINNTTYQPEIVILALGNSARDTFSLLKDRGILLESKPFAVGFRIEHTQDYINNTFYGDKADFSLTGPAVYNITAQCPPYGIYSFCMCPGGFVIPASSSEGFQVVNGMSNLKRDNIYANSAIVATVNQNDFGNGILDGIHFQEKIESMAFDKYRAPMQTANDYLSNRSNTKITRHSYSLGQSGITISSLFPDKLNNALRSALTTFNKSIPHFADEGILVAPETRTSCPIRICRDDFHRYSLSATNLYPIGEGSGYAGGIISSASDGIKTALLFHI